MLVENDETGRAGDTGTGIYLKGKRILKIMTFNANGIRSAHKKGFFEWFMAQDIDALCVQELKAQQADLGEEITQIPGYHAYFHCAQKRGYSGCGLWVKEKPLAVRYGYGNEEFDAEGRYVEADYGDYCIISCYFPSGTSSDDRLQAKYRFLDSFLLHLKQLREQGKEVILCGDVNIAHQNIDLKNWKGNLKHSGFLPEERQWLTNLFDNEGWVDVYRRLYPTREQYTWWSQRGQARAKNVGWRIDYQLATPALAQKATQGSVYAEEKFSDHAPLTIEYLI